MKRMLVAGVSGLLCTALFVMPVSAHGHHESRKSCRTDTEQLCEICTEEGCAEDGWHIHDGVTYCGYDHEDGYCDGTCDAVRVCTAAKCTEEGRHIHDGITYCGYDHESGYCDQSCEQQAAASVKKGYGRHHGHH